MAKLTEHQKLFVIKALAEYNSYGDVNDMLNEHYGFTLPIQNISRYDPTKPSGSPMTLKLKEYFYKCRKDFEEDFSAIPIANPSYRLAELQKLFQKAKRSGNIVMCSNLLEQAAKEAYKVYSRSAENGASFSMMMAEFYAKIQGSSLPIVHDVYDDDDVIENPPQKEIETKPKRTRLILKPKQEGVESGQAGN